MTSRLASQSAALVEKAVAELADNAKRYASSDARDGVDPLRGIPRGERHLRDDHDRLRAELVEQQNSEIRDANRAADAARAERAQLDDEDGTRVPWRHFR